MQFKIDVSVSTSSESNLINGGDAAHPALKKFVRANP
jgi:hypothetical protein